MTQSALLLRGQVQLLRLPGMLRWDATGRALLISDAPRHIPWETLPHCLPGVSSATLSIENHLLRIDLPLNAYIQALHAQFYQLGSWQTEWFAEQACLAGLLSRKTPGHIDRSALSPPPDISLLRHALLATLQGEAKVRAFLDKLRPLDAQSLRDGGHPLITRACATICANWLWRAKAVGLPPTAQVSFSFL